MNAKKIFIILFLFIFYFIFYSFSYSYSVSNNLEDTLFRLHVIANSDSKEDQDLKIYIRDKVVTYLKNFSFDNKKELVEFLNSHQSELQQIIDSAIAEQGYQYTASFEIGNSYYPQKKYENIILPSGYYDGLKIKIGKAEGKNWWCVLFPPMCLIDSSTCELPEESEIILENTLSNESNSLVSSNESNYKFKFKLVDFINNL